MQYAFISKVKTTTNNIKNVLNLFFDKNHIYTSQDILFDRSLYKLRIFSVYEGAQFKHYPA